MKVFLSHASADKPLVRQIADGLDAAGIEVWLDEADVRVGESIPEAVTAGLAASDALLFAFSKEASKSRWAQREINAFFVIAMSSGKPILPCRLDNSEPPTLLADIKYADFRDGIDAGLPALLGSVGVAEEIALAKRAERVATQLSVELSPDERQKCFGQWVLKDGLRVDLMTWSSGGLLERTYAVVRLLNEHGLIHDQGPGTGHTPSDLHWVATSLGQRVFALWKGTHSGIGST